MKTLKKIAVLCIILGFTSNNANSQPVRTEHSVYVNFYIPCVYERVAGVVIFHDAFWYNQGDESIFPFSKSLVKYEGTLIGQTTHLEYTIDFIANNVLQDREARSTTFVRTLMIRQDGKLIARLPITVHTTINANDEQTVYFNDSDVDCK